MPHLLKNFDIYSVPSPSYVIDEVQLERNLQILADVQTRSGAKVLLALKAFSCFALAPLVMKYLKGTCASGVYEAKLGSEEYGGEVHTYAAAYREQDFDEVLALSHHVVFNSFSQWQRYQTKALASQANKPEQSFGLRINPEHSEGTTAIYNPCAPCSRMGIPLANFKDQDLNGIDGLHFHTLCQQGFDALARTLDVIEEKFGDILPRMQWVNFGGGHHITREGYDTEGLIARIQAFSQKYQVQVYLEPGEAVALNAGIFVTEVQDIISNSMNIAILDASATCHMPDVLEMPYRPEITGAGESGEFAHTYRLGGPSCLSGDVISDYSFTQPLEVGQRLMFEDMAIYTMVKNSTFNGIPLPTIVIANSQTNHAHVVKSFSYQDFKMRLS
ncbi:MAG: carboxynorspermidine decarboxylase [Marinagarivorans sp.]|nr:carboxynorspermidine decarboxylase [Marinagarivorans sp.]